ncbi:Signal recognition particle subunit SRP72 [Hirschfeldia incana]|nr:Signal recognition particle subunit SRP72 [Hirschfeldia incana]
MPSHAIEDLFASLNIHIKRSEYEQAVKVADQVLAIAPADEDAIRCKVVALVKDNKIDDALSVIHSFHKLPIDLGFHMAEVNFVADLVSAGKSSHVQGALESRRIKPTSSFELAFNTACSFIENCNYADAEQLLLAAKGIGHETLTDEGIVDEDIETKLAPIAVQLAYVQQVIGQTQESTSSYVDIIKRNLADEPSLAVAVNNLVALKGSKDISDSLGKLDQLKEKDSQTFQLSQTLDAKLSQKHKEAIYANRVLLLLHSNKMDQLRESLTQARELCATLPGLLPESVVPTLLQAAVLVRENKAAKAEELLGHCAEKFPENSKLVLLARAQIAASANHPHVAAESLSRITDIQHFPATVATIVALKERAGDNDGAAAVLDSAIKWWSNLKTENSRKQLSILMTEAASFKLRHGQEEEASRLYEEIVKKDKSIDALVGLVTTLARVDVEKAETYEKQLKPLPGLKAVDVDNLEKTSGANPMEGTTAMQEELKRKDNKAKTARKRKPRYPKGFDPANPGPRPDPERWLPRRERSSYRPKRKDKRAAQIRGSQGAVTKKDKQEPAPATSKSNQSATKSAAAKKKSRK